MPNRLDSQSPPAPDVSPSRRRFLGWVSGVGFGLVGAALAGLAGGFLSSSRRRTAGSRRVRLAHWDELPDDGYLRVSVPMEIDRGWRTVTVRSTVFVRRDGDDRAVVLSGLCTHMGCPVQWSAGERQFVCPCHDGRFTADGDVLSGPVPRPLDRFPTTIEDGEIHGELPEPR